MGVSLKINLTPYINIKKYKNIDVPKVRRICPTHITLKINDEKFCPYCGIEIINQDYTESHILEPYKVFRNAELDEDELYEIEYLAGVLYPNRYPPHNINIEEEKNMAHNLLHQSDLIHAQVLWFKEKYERYIVALYEAYGAENVEVCWGLVHYWS